MLVALSIRNLAVIENVQLHFNKGFHVLTGETGAGKSIIIDALSLIIGGRGSADLVRFGAEKAEIEALFDLPPGHPVWETCERLGIEASPDEHLLIRREVTSQGKSSARVNGQMVNLSMLKTIGEMLVNIHGQHEHQSLLKAEEHIKWLDLYGEKDIQEAKDRYISAYRIYKNLLEQLQELEQSSQKTLHLLDLYRFQREEIAAARLKAGEDEYLWEEKQKLANAEKLFSAVSEAYDVLYGESLEKIGRAVKKLDEASAYDASLALVLEQIQTAYYQLEDAAFQLRDYRNNIEFNPSRLDQIEQRLDAIHSLKRKYGESIEQILSYFEKISSELERLENRDAELERLQKELSEAKRQMASCAEELTEKRKKTAVRLARQIVKELGDLHMDKCRFEVCMEPLDKYGENGADEVEFLISANPGEPLRSLNKVASGGELSRIMLALKTIFARLDQIPVLIFDEVDTGVSGRTAQAIAEKISKLSKECQVFCITHLPQVACMADEHFAIHKEVEGDRTVTRVQCLDERGRVQELSRMLGGVEVTQTTEHHAKEMLILANEKKATL